MKRLFLVRHGQTKWNIEKRVQGNTNTDLTEEGLNQAYKVSNRLKDYKVDYIYSSDLNRAYKTAEIIGKKLNVKINKLNGLREKNFGHWQGLTIDDIQSKFYEEHYIWKTKPHNAKIEGAESLIQVQERVLSSINELKKKHKCKNVLLVSHGSTIKALILGILGIDISNYNKLTISNVGLTIIDFTEYSPIIRVLNDTSHISSE